MRSSKATERGSWNGRRGNGSRTRGRFSGQRGRPGLGSGVATRNGTGGAGPAGRRRGSWYRGNRGKPGGGTGPHFGNAFEEGTGEEIGASLDTPTAIRRLP